jgi:hypothetical protein
VKKITAALAAVTLAGGMVALSAAPAQAAPLSTWDFSQTRATGHYELVENGLHIWTEGATSTDKVAAYLPVAIPLASASSAGVEYTASFGMLPGSQLVVDVSGDGVGDGILVGESVYGDDFWLSNASTDAFKALAPHVGGGSGSQWFGTLAEWGDHAPDAKIVTVGFSLGSGAHGDGIVHSVTVGDEVFDFDPDYLVGEFLGKGPWSVASCTEMTVTQEREVFFAQTVSYDGGTTWEPAANFVENETKEFKRNKNSACPA